MSLLPQLQYAAIGISDRECFEEDELGSVAVNHHQQPVNGSATNSSTASEKREEETLFDEPKYVKGEREGGRERERAIDR